MNKLLKIAVILSAASTASLVTLTLVMLYIANLFGG
jgi:hypothetical protein